MAVGDNILKSWLRQKYTDNNTLKTRFGSGSSLTVPDTSNSSAAATDINTLVTSLRAMQSNTYLRHSPLWSSVNIANVSAGTSIAHTKKVDIDNLMTDLLAMCANNTKTPTGCNYRANTPTSFTANDAHTNNFTAFTNNASNLSFSQSTSWDETCFFWGSNYGSNYRGNTRRFTFSNFAEFASFSQTARFDSRGGGTFTQRSGNAVFGAHTLTFTQRFNASFVVKSDRSTTTNSNVVD